MPEPDGTLLIGGLVGPRIQSAKDRMLVNNEFVPTSHLVRFGMNAFLRESEVYLHYAESMALAVYLMQSR
jgi:hypothetical protein